MYSPLGIKIGVFLRFAFFINFIYIVGKPNTPIIGSDAYILANTALFASANGFLTGSLFIIASEKGVGKVRELSGVIMSFCLLAGITLGTFLALPFKGIKPWYIYIYILRS